MLQNKFEMPLDLIIRPSKIFYSYLLITFLLALTSIVNLSSLPISSRILLIVLLLFISTFVIKELKYKQVNHLRLNSAGEWELELNNKKCFDVELSGECIVTYFLVWLNFSVIKTEGKRAIFRVLLLPDSSNKDLLRQLRVRLRYLESNDRRMMD